jgi:hypothetical protein
MKTILAILKQAGGWHHGLSLKIENPPYMALVIEATDESGPCGLPVLSVCHYGEQNGDLMRVGNYCYHPQLHEQHADFAKTWDNNLRSQSFVEAFAQQQAPRT